MISAKPVLGQSRLRRAMAFLLLSVLVGSSPASGADTFSFERRLEVKLAGSRNAERPYTRAQVAGAWREILGSTGRLALERRSLFVGPGGRLFVAAEVPEALASSPRDLDVYVLRDGSWEKRGELQYEPGASTVVSRTFVLPDLPVGVIDTEVHVRGVHRADWQELNTAPITIPKDGSLRMGFGLEGVDRDRAVPIEVVIGMRYGEDKQKVLFHRDIKPQKGRTTWQEVEFDLSRMAGSEATFVFRSRPTSEDGPAPGVVWGAPEVSFELERKAFPILAMVSLDSLRTGSLGIFGSEAGSSPFIDRYFAKHGAAFTRALAAATTTLPSHMSLMTSLNPSVHQVTNETRSLASDVPTLASLLKKAGWNTVAFTDGGALAGEFGFARGFDLYDEGSAIFPPKKNQPNAIDRASAWLRKYQGGPVFVFVHSYASRPFSFTPVRGAHETGTTRSYRSAVSEVDASLKVFVDTMNKVGAAERSIIAVTSGHAEEFGEHGALGHGTQLYEESIRVPLLIAGGRIRGGKRYQDPVGLIDVAPTLLGLAGLEVPREMQGRSLARALTGGRFSSLPYRFSEAHRTKRLTAVGRLQSFSPPSFTVRDGRYKVMMHGNGGRGTSFEAYDLVEDPGERRNLAGKRMPNWASRLVRVLTNYPGICRRLEKRSGGTPRLDATDRAKLRVLGYAE